MYFAGEFVAIVLVVNAVRTSTLWLMAFSLSMVSLACVPFWLIASNWADLSELRATVAALGVPLITGVLLIVRDVWRYRFDRRRRPGDLQRRTRRVLGVPIVDDSEGH